jgi:hypothetical protein
MYNQDGSGYKMCPATDNDGQHVIIAKKNENCQVILRMTDSMSVNGEGT